MTKKCILLLLNENIINGIEMKNIEKSSGLHPSPIGFQWTPMDSTLVL